MARWKNGLAAALVMLAAGSGHAASGVLDFDGFTISYTNSGEWNWAGTFSQQTQPYRDGGLDAHTGQPYTTATGVDGNYGDAVFGTARPFELASRGGQGSISLDASFTYTVAAKTGWQLSDVSAWYYHQGTYREAGGGAVVIDTRSNVSSQGGDTYRRGNTSKTPTIVSPSETSGTWYGDALHGGSGGELRYDIRYTGTGGEETGYDAKWSIAHRDFAQNLDPMTSVSGSFSRTLSVTSTDASQLAFIDGVSGPFGISVLALRSVSPIPEPDTYVLVAASFGMMGCLARRRAQRKR